ncbi:hypothetical protein Q4561_02495 [Alteromonas sp. 1_MG-2023]|nr:hypothetical protein [Alteromonas sp. 1_MG-2023]MDO6565919.1 hypothetical protein [Alteromonas sp. 1_MG-2023]
MMQQKSAEGIVAKRPSYWLGHGEGLNMKINKELVQLIYSVPDLV